MDYKEHFELQQVLDKQATILPSPNLYDFDDQAVLAAMMNKLAQPLPSGAESPFSSMTPGSAHGVLMSVMVYMQSLIGHEINLVPDRTWVHLFRMYGIEMLPAEYPIVLLKFTKSQDAIANRFPVDIPISTQVNSTVEASLGALTVTNVSIGPDETSVTVPARLTQLGAIRGLRTNEFSDLGRQIPFIESVTNFGDMVNEGRGAETLAEAMLRAREEITIQQRCVTARDYHFWAMRLGATKANVIPKIQPGSEGIFRDLISVAIYPAIKAPVIAPQLNAMTLADQRLMVVPAEIIPITGSITVKVLPELTDADARNIAASAIIREINPPYGIWGDEHFRASLADAIERTNGIYATEKMLLTHAETGEPISDLKIHPWQLFEIQNSIQINSERF